MSQHIMANDTVVTVEERPQFLTAHRGARISDHSTNWSGLSFYENNSKIIQEHYKKITRLEEERRKVMEEERMQQKMEKHLKAALQREKFREKCQYNKAKRHEMLKGRAPLKENAAMPRASKPPAFVPFLIVSRIQFERDKAVKRPRRPMSAHTISPKTIQKEMQELDDFETKLEGLNRTRQAFYRASIAATKSNTG